MMYNVTMMHRTQLLLEQWQYETLKTMALQRQSSLSQLLREMVTQVLQTKRKPDHYALQALEGIIEDSNFSGKEHDQVLYGR